MRSSYGSTTGATMNYKLKKVVNQTIDLHLNPNRFRILNDDLWLHFQPFLVKPFSILHEQLDIFIQQCYQHGFFVYLQSKYLPPLLSNRKEGPRVLTMQMLSAGFTIWLAAVLCSIIVFIIEHIVYYISMRRYSLEIFVEVIDELEVIEVEENSEIITYID